MDRSEFAQLVRDALPHLYDPVRLQLSPLSDVFAAKFTRDTRESTVRRLLLEAIDALRPAPRVPADTPAWRPYNALHARYIEGMDAVHAAEELYLSPRQVRREHAKGVEAVTEYLWTKYVEPLSPAQAVGANEQELWVGSNAQAGPVAGGMLLETEVIRLGATTGGEENTTIGSVVEGVVETLQGLAAQQGTSIVADLPQDLPSLSLERVVLRQLLLSIIVHFVERSCQDRITITGSVRGESVHLTFRRANVERSEKTGQRQESERLAVAERLVSLQGGELQIVEGNKTCVELSLPICQQPAVLVIDDNPDLILLFQRYLRGGQYRTIGASTLEQALHLAVEARPRAILLDVMMPGQDGWELLQRFKHHPATAHVPIIICSVLQERTLALSLGAANFIAKPVSQQTLLQVLRECLALPEPREHRG